MIVALAGHVDHGKTALIGALTGARTDRLPEEQRRGMTIDLGFAYLHAPDGTTVGFVDVPGHERFLPNMLAGVLGIDSVLLIVAADDGPMPQTVEHLAVLQLTGAAEITAVITKTDMVDAARIDAVQADLAALLARHNYPGAPILRASAVTADGIAPLRERLLAQARAQRRGESGGGFRLAIDRRFVLHGVGLVVTGTVVSGSVAPGDSLLLSPPRQTARVRSLRVQDRPADRARMGDRCALAITGARIDADRVQRGHWLIAPGLHAPTQMLDLHLRVAAGHLLRHGTRGHLHLGTAAIGGRVRVLTGADLPAASEAYVRLTLDAPIAALHGDRAVLRDDGSGRIVAGGRVVDPFPPARRRKRDEWRARLDALHHPDPAVAFASLLAAEGSVDLAAFRLARNLDEATIAAIIAHIDALLIGPTARKVAISASVAAGLRARLRDVLGEWHALHPDYAGPNHATLLSRAAPRPLAGAAEAVLHDLIADGTVLRDGIAYRLPGHAPRLTHADEALWDRLEPLLQAAALRPPRVRELAGKLGLELEPAAALLQRLARFGRLQRVAANRYFLPGTIATFAAIATELAEAADGFTAAEFNRRTGIGRNLTIQVLEYLDSIGATQRHGELRHTQA